MSIRSVRWFDQSSEADARSRASAAPGSRRRPGRPRTTPAPQPRDQSSRKPGCRHGVGAVHDLQVDVRLGGVARAPARGERLSRSYCLPLLRHDRSTQQVRPSDVPSPALELDHQVIPREASRTAREPLRACRGSGPGAPGCSAPASVPPAAGAGRQPPPPLTIPNGGGTRRPCDGATTPPWTSCGPRRRSSTTCRRCRSTSR